MRSTEMMRIAGRVVTLGGGLVLILYGSARGGTDETRQIVARNRTSPASASERTSETVTIRHVLAHRAGDRRLRVSDGPTVATSRDPRVIG